MQRWKFPITTVHEKDLSNQGWIMFQCFCFSKLLFSFAVSLQKWLAHSYLIRSNVPKLSEIYTSQVRKTTLSSTFLIRLRFQSTVVNRTLPSLYGWRVTWPFTSSFICHKLIFFLIFILTLSNITANFSIPLHQKIRHYTNIWLKVILCDP